jgi:hypothetical protein
LRRRVVDFVVLRVDEAFVIPAAPDVSPLCDAVVIRPGIPGLHERLTPQYIRATLISKQAPRKQSRDLDNQKAGESRFVGIR